MHKVFTVGLSVSMVAILSLGIVACSPNEASNKNSENAQIQDAPVARAEKGVVAGYSTKLALKDATSFTEDNYLITAIDKKFTITSSGTLPADQEKLSAAKGEKFHAINYTYADKTQGSLGETGPPAITLTIDGTTTTPNISLYSEGTLLVSAPENAEIILGIQENGITQSINLNDAKRVEGLADGWYESTVGKLSSPSVTESKTVGEVTANLKLSFNDVTRTPYLEEDPFKWANDGKGTWVVLDLDSADWDIKGADAIGQSAKITLRDDKGTEYPGKTNSGSFDSSTKMMFAVPTGINSFTIHTENSTDLTSWGDKLGSTGVIMTDKVKITFDEKK